MFTHHHGIEGSEELAQSGWLLASSLWATTCSSTFNRPRPDDGDRDSHMDGRIARDRIFATAAAKTESDFRQR